MNQIERLALEKVKLARRMHEIDTKSEKVYQRKFDTLEHQLDAVNEKLDNEIRQAIDRLEQIARWYKVIQIRSGYNRDMEWYHVHEIIMKDGKKSPFDSVNKYVQAEHDKDERFKDRVNRMLGLGKYKKEGEQ
jgi:hypothetical protein